MDIDIYRRGWVGASRWLESLLSCSAGAVGKAVETKRNEEQKWATKGLLIPKSRDVKSVLVTQTHEKQCSPINSTGW